MKTKNIASSAFVKTSTSIMIGLLVIMAGWIFFLALQGDTTLLGDPYYEDQVLAPARAFGPWALCLLVVLNATITKIVLWYNGRHI